jgi:hypothetical protein
VVGGEDEGLLRGLLVIVVRDLEVGLEVLDLQHVRVADRRVVDLLGEAGLEPLAEERPRDRLDVRAHAVR